MPNDTTMHEFLALVYFAQGKFDQAASPLYAVLSVGPGWDWTTLSGMYPDVTTYTSQLRALEANVRANRDTASGHFVTGLPLPVPGPRRKCRRPAQAGRQASACGHPLGPAHRPASALRRHSTCRHPARRGRPGKLAGNWTAAPGNDTKISLAIQDDGRFTWTATSPGKPATTISGGSTLADGVLTLAAQGSQDGARSPAR